MAGWIGLSVVAGSGSKAGCGVGGLTTNFEFFSVSPACPFSAAARRDCAPEGGGVTQESVALSAEQTPRAPLDELRQASDQAIQSGQQSSNPIRAEIPSLSQLWRARPLPVRPGSMFVL